MRESSDNKTVTRFISAKQAIEALAEKVDGAAKVSSKDLIAGLSELFQSIKSGCEEVNTGRISGSEASDAGIRRDVLDTWQDLQEHHLPVSLALLREQWQVKSLGTSQQPCEKSPVLLLMAGYSIEQLVLCIAINYYERGVRHVVPFAGQTSTGESSWDAGEILTRLQHVGISVGTDDDASLTLCSPNSVVASNPARVFQSILAWSRNERNQGFRCWLDVTGGQKPMDSGASYAAMYLGWDAYYLDFTDYDSGLRRPTPESLRYERLVLPGVVFSHNARRDVLTHFRDRRFRLALERLTDITELGKQSEFTEYFPKEDLDAFGQAEAKIRQCVALMGADYPADCLKGVRPGLHGHFKKEQGRLREKLHELMKPAPSGDEDSLLQYVCDEYWRLESLLQLAKGSSATDDLRVPYSEGIREVIVGSVGLAELIADALLLVDSTELRISSVSGVAFVTGNDALPTLLFGDDSKRFDSLVTKLKTFPRHRFPPSGPSAKAKLLRGKTARFSVWAPATNTRIAGRPADEAVEVVAMALNSHQECSENDARYVVDCELQFAAAFVEGSNKVWADSFGDFGSNNARWFGTRHLIAHMRAPMQQEQRELAKNAISEYLPRFIGLLAALRQGTSKLPMDAETSREAGQNVLHNQKDSMPWYAPDAETELCDQLQLPPGQ